MQQLDDLALKAPIATIKKGFCQSLHLSLVLNHKEMNQYYQLLD